MLQGHWEVENPGRSRPGASLTFTSVAGLALLVPCRALALVGSHGVDAIPALAEARDGLALIHICGKRSKGVRESSHGSVSSVDLPVLQGAGSHSRRNYPSDGTRNKDREWTGMNSWLKQEGDESLGMLPKGCVHPMVL